MIGVVDVELQAKSPCMPLFPMRAYVSSPSSIRVRNVPKRIGKWNIENVYFTVAYPDGSIKSTTCVLTGGIWTGTIEGTSTSGTSQNGYTIFADGTDENGNPVTGYILGKGDVIILEADGTINPQHTEYYVHLLSAQPSDPAEGDLFPLSGEYYIWQNGAAHAIGDDSGAIDAVKADVAQLSADKRDKTDLSVYTYAPWTMYSYNEQEMSPPLNFIYQKVIYSDDREIYGWMSEREWQGMWHLISHNGNNWFWVGGEIDADGKFTVLGGDLLTISDDGLSITTEGGMTPVDIRRTTTGLVPTSDTLAKVSQIPTSFGKIQDLSGNVIHADREVNYVGEVDKWTVNIDGQDYVLTGEKDEAEYVPENPQSGDVKYTLSWSATDSMWFLKYYEWSNEDWEQTDSFSFYDEYDSTFLEFNGGEGQTASWGQVVESDELALKSYVDSQIGQVLTEAV